MRELNPDVLVVGAGPTGLMLAAWLAKLGVDAAVVDGKEGPTRESRALGVHSRSMEIYDQLGVIDRLLNEAWPVTKIRPGYEKRTFAALSLGTMGAGLTPYPGMYVLEQSRNEQILLDRLMELGGVVQWEHRLANLDADGAGVVAECTGPEGRLRIRARFCVGADGGSSTVRKLAGILFEGKTNAHTFYVADVLGASGVAEDSVNLRYGADEFLLGFPMGAGGHHRLLGVVPSTAGSGMSEFLARQNLERTFDVRYSKSIWFSTYRTHHRVAARFRQGPVFLAGDAAHLHSPVGAQGMNTGLQDAHNLATKFADVLQGRATEAVLERYEAERRPVALHLVNSTDRAFGMVTSTHPVLRLLRRVGPQLIGPIATPLVPRLPLARRLFGYLSQIRIHYWMAGSESMNDDDGASQRWRRRGRVVGRRLPWTGSNFDVLRSATWQIHTYGEIDSAVSAAVGRELQLSVHSFTAAPDKGLEKGTCYLIRPDGFVAGAAPIHRAVSMLRSLLPDRWFAQL